MSHALRVGVADQIGYFRAYNTDGSAKTDLTSSTTGLTLSVFRIGAAAVSISSLSAKAADNTAHADGAIRAVSGNLYTVDLPDAACADQVPSISVKGSYTGGVIEGPEHPLVGYNPASVAVGANTTTPPTVGAIADQVWDEARSGHTTTGTFGEKVNAELDPSARVKLATDQPDYAPATAAALADVQTDIDANTGYLTSLVSSMATLLGRVTASVYQMFLDQISMITGSGTADAKFDAIALSNAPSGSSLTGPYTRTIVITDADTGDGIEGAQVRLYRAGESQSKRTVDGNEVEFTVAAATWSYAVTANGYTGQSGTITVSGDGETPIELTPLSIAPGDVGQTTGWLITRVRGTATAGITIRYQQVQEPDDDTGSSYDTTIYEAVSDSEGLAELTLILGGRYYIWRGLTKKPESTPITTIPANAGSTYELPSHVGK